jgi:hypothetical protein
MVSGPSEMRAFEGWIVEESRSFPFIAFRIGMTAFLLAGGVTVGL